MRFTKDGAISFFVAKAPQKNRIGGSEQCRDILMKDAQTKTWILMFFPTCFHKVRTNVSIFTYFGSFDAE